MKLLLTSAGISNTSIHNALVDFLGKPVAESTALFMPTAIYAIKGGADIVSEGQVEGIYPKQRTADKAIRNYLTIEPLTGAEDL